MLHKVLGTKTVTLGLLSFVTACNSPQNNSGSSWQDNSGSSWQSNSESLLEKDLKSFQKWQDSGSQKTRPEYIVNILEANAKINFEKYSRRQNCEETTLYSYVPDQNGNLELTEIPIPIETCKNRENTPDEKIADQKKLEIELRNNKELLSTILSANMGEDSLNVKKIQAAVNAFNRNGNITLENFKKILETPQGQF